MTEVEIMRRALALAGRGRGRTSPNPMVGAVIVTPDGSIAGTGYHQRAGEAHAEVLALIAAGPRARGATLYCTLEPCCHHGKTGPCVLAICEAGIARVVVAVEDPNPLVAGGGLRYLRAHGIDVRCGVLEDEARRLNEAFFTALTEHRPFVTAKVATSLDGRVAGGTGACTRLTSEDVDRLMQRQRAEVDALMVGAETVLTDDPRLTVRDVYRYRPLARVILDGRLRVGPDARVFRTLDAGPCYVVTSPETLERAPRAAQALEAAGARVLTAALHDFRAALARLHELEIRHVLLEGGPQVQRAAFAAEAVDRVQVIVTPKVLGPAGVPWLDADEVMLSTLTHRTTRVCGPDVLIEGYVHRTH